MSGRIMRPLAFCLLSSFAVQTPALRYGLDAAFAPANSRSEDSS
jgi:hypothetical protein